jgi:hypothetical protein
VGALFLFLEKMCNATVDKNCGATEQQNQSNVEKEIRGKGMPPKQAHAFH